MNQSCDNVFSFLETNIIVRYKIQLVNCMKTVVFTRPAVLVYNKLLFATLRGICGEMRHSDHL